MAFIAFCDQTLINKYYFIIIIIYLIDWHWHRSSPVLEEEELTWSFGD